MFLLPLHLLDAKVSEALITTRDAAICKFHIKCINTFTDTIITLLCIHIFLMMITCCTLWEKLFDEKSFPKTFS